MELGLGHLLYQRPVEVAVSLNVARQEANTRFQKLLGPDGPRKLSGLWKGQRAGVVALRIMRNVLLGNWPELQDVRSPVSALRQSATSQMVSPMKDLFRSVTGRMTHASVPLSEDNVPHYPRIVPSDITFRAYIDLLAEEELIPLIPLVLAWMQRLHIRPSRSTLATALVYWVEVSTDAPLVQKMKGGPLRSPYMKLRRWMSRWVGHHNMPMGEDIQVALRRIRFFREMGSYIMTPRRRK
ncbi:hypothetical protein A0H81_05431 [Grifola frondosa]|uniref:Uncharacterized protein n=1 Tax=Grifola frondosa TaxID=5627 RepID=A0A1C7MEW2_GRIFR|nr:hypothetical protein A0H81_05431 [Grifola frondosa]